MCYEQKRTIRQVLAPQDTDSLFDAQYLVDLFFITKVHHTILIMTQKLNSGFSK